LTTRRPAHRDRRWRRRAWWLLAVAVVVVLVAHPQAGASSDAFRDVGPGGIGGGLAGRYPLGNYALDQHFNGVEASLTGGVDVSGVPPLIAYFLADVLWQLTAFLANALITLFGFAFSLDLVNGSQATGGAGALQPVAAAVRTIYTHVFGEAWTVVAVVLAGLWAMWKALVQRRYTETAGALGLSVVFMVIALAFVTQPERTIGQATHWTNQLSAAFLSLSDHGDLSDETRARQQASDQLFGLLVYEPWAVLDFGGLEHCAKLGTGSKDHDPVSVPVRPLAADPRRDAQLSGQLRTGTEVTGDGKACVNNRNKYGPHFLRYAPGSGDRGAEYDALNHGDTGKLPSSDPAKKNGGYPLSAVDKPASDAMEKGGQYQRLLIAALVFVSELGAFLLLGALSVAVVLAQVLVLLLLAFAPVALVAAIYPGRGHDLFRNWLTRLAGFLLRKAVYSLILAILLAVAAALQDASANLGWLMSFGLQALFFWAVFLYRRQLAGHLTLAATGAAPGQRDDALRRVLSLYTAGRVLRRRTHHAPRNASPPPRRAEHERQTDQPPPPHAAPEPPAPPPESAAGAEPTLPPPTRRSAPSGSGQTTAQTPNAPGGSAPTVREQPADSPHQDGPTRAAEPAPTGGSAQPNPQLQQLHSDRERLAAKPPPPAPTPTPPQAPASVAPAPPSPSAAPVPPPRRRDEGERR
jgi:hypothetical protein